MKTKAFVLLGQVAWFLCGAGAAAPVAVYSLWNQTDPSWWHWVLPIFCFTCLLVFPIAWYAQRWTRRQIGDILDNAKQQDGEYVTFTKKDMGRLAQFAPELADAIRSGRVPSTDQ